MFLGKHISGIEVFRFKEMKGSIMETEFKAEYGNTIKSILDWIMIALTFTSLILGFQSWVLVPLFVLSYYFSLLKNSL